VAVTTRDLTWAAQRPKITGAMTISSGQPEPSYAELCQRTDAPPGSAWGLWGPDDELGTLNRLTPERTVAAARLIQTGMLFPLDAPVDVLDPCAWRPVPIRYHLGAGSPGGRDDYLDRFYLQGSSQWDGLRHTQHPRYGFYNGVPAAAVDDPASKRLGIQAWAERGIAGRGVLLDVARYLTERGVPYDVELEYPYPPELLDAVAEAQGVRFEPGDLLLVRTGWLGAYQQWPPARRAALHWQTAASPGLEPSERMAAWLWDHGLAAVAADNLALEAMPLRFDPERFLHYRLQALLGMPIGELWSLDALAAACAADGRYTFFLVSKPLNVPGGVGSPPNAMAIK
jgi:kynurenine formamidase